MDDPTQVGDTDARSALPYTLGIFGLGHTPDPAGQQAATDLVRYAVSQVVGLPDAVIDVRTNNEVHAALHVRCAIVEAAGFDLFQEKQGYLWRADGDAGELPDPQLRLVSIAQTGVDRFAEVMAAAAYEQTWDRSNRFTAGRCGPRGWAEAAVADYFTPGTDELTWNIVQDDSGQDVGFFALSAFDEPDTATIIQIGVLPQHRGQGWAVRLLRAAGVAAQAAGFCAIMSDVDVENIPMARALQAAGHRDDLRPWHVWHHRHQLSGAPGTASPSA